MLIFALLKRAFQFCSSSPFFMAGGGSPVYEIQKSLRLRSVANAYLSKVFATGSLQTKGTVSFWARRGKLGAVQDLFMVGSNGTTWAGLYFNADDTLSFSRYNAGYQCQLTTAAVFRDPAAWLHIVVSWDSTQATASNRVTIEVNGQAVTSFSTATYPAQNLDMYLFNGDGVTPHQIGAYTASAIYFEGGFSEFYGVAGAKLSSGSFGYLDAAVNAWRPKKYSGTYGTNGFYLDFSTGTNLTTLGQDRSGNGNNWTLNNVSLTAGVTYDWLDDTPTNKFATLNPLTKLGVGSVTCSNSNLQVVGSGGGYIAAVSSIGMSSGKWYFEAVLQSSSGTSDQWGLGLYDATKINTASGAPWQYLTTYSLLGNGSKYNNNANGGASGVGAWGALDVMGVAFDADSGVIQVNKNGGAFTTLYTSIPAGTYLFGVNVYAATDVMAANFGQRPFAYAPPSGFKSLCAKNLPDPTGAARNPKAHFDALTHAGTNGVAGTVTGAQFQPDLVWGKTRSSVQSHTLVDSVRGGSKGLFSDLTNAEATNAGFITSFNSGGFSYGTSSAFSNGAIVDWLWKAGGAAVANNAGSIASQVSANTDAGFSIVTFSKAASTNETVGHGLGTAPKLVITKSLSGTNNWLTWYAGLGGSEYLSLNTTDAKATLATLWNSAVPTSTVLNFGTAWGAGPVVAYCVFEVPGYSKIGSYTGNGLADGPFVYCGFKPRWILVKRTDIAANWQIFDTARDAFNVSQNSLVPNLSSAEVGGYAIDILSNGFKPKAADAGYNASGGTYIFWAIAETNIKYSTAR